MATDVPVTIWRPADGESEMGLSDSAEITTLSGVGITTLSGNQLVIDGGTYTQKPVTIWTEDDGQ